MKTIISILLFSLMIGMQGNAQVAFQKTYGGMSMETCYDAKQTKDMGYIMVGLTYSFGAGYSDVYLVKTDSIGEIQWTRTYGGNDDDGGYYVEQTADSGYVIIGYTFSFGFGQEDVYIIKTDFNGDTLWTKTYGYTKYEHGTCIKQTPSGGYVFTGNTYSYNGYNSNLLLVGLDASGNQTWMDTYGGDTLFTEGNSIHQTWDGGYIVVGSSASFSPNPNPYLSHIYLLKTNALGSLLWSKTYGGNNEDYGYDARQSSDGGFIICGTTHSFGAGNGDIYLIKTDNTGNVIWSKTYGGPNFDDGRSVHELLNGGYLIGGTTENYGGVNSYVCLLKTDASGTLLFSETFGGSSCSNSGISVQQTHDGGCMVAGTTCSFPDTTIHLYGNDFYLMKTEYFDNSLCSNGTVNLTTSSAATTVRNVFTVQGPTNSPLHGPFEEPTQTSVGTGGLSESHCFEIGIHEPKNKDIATFVFPNPCKDYTIITITNGEKITNDINLQLFDVMGREIQIQYELIASSPNEYTITLNTYNLPYGVYICRIKEGDSFVKGLKVIVDR